MKNKIRNRTVYFHAELSTKNSMTNFSKRLSHGKAWEGQKWL